MFLVLDVYSIICKEWNTIITYLRKGLLAEVHLLIDFNKRFTIKIKNAKYRLMNHELNCCPPNVISHPLIK